MMPVLRGCGFCRGVVAAETRQLLSGELVMCWLHLEAIGLSQMRSELCLWLACVERWPSWCSGGVWGWRRAVLLPGSLCKLGAAPAAVQQLWCTSQLWRRAYEGFCWPSTGQPAVFHDSSFLGRLLAAGIVCIHVAYTHIYPACDCVGGWTPQLGRVCRVSPVNACGGRPVPLPLEVSALCTAAA